MMNDTTVRAETFEWAGPVFGPRVETGMSGLAYLAGVRDGMVPPPDLGPLLRAELVEVDRGRVELICSAADPHFGLLWELDPGLAGVLLSTAVNCVARSLMGLHQGWATVAAQSAYVRPISPRVSNLISTAEVIESSDRRAIVRAELTDEFGQVLATASTTLDIFDRDPCPTSYALELQG